MNDARVFKVFFLLIITSIMFAATYSWIDYRQTADMKETTTEIKSALQLEIVENANVVSQSAVLLTDVPPGSTTTTKILTSLYALSVPTYNAFRVDSEGYLIASTLQDFKNGIELDVAVSHLESTGQVDVILTPYQQFNLTDNAVAGSVLAVTMYRSNSNEYDGYVGVTLDTASLIDKIVRSLPEDRYFYVVDSSGCIVYSSNAYEIGNNFPNELKDTYASIFATLWDSGSQFSNDGKLVWDTVRFGDNGQTWKLILTDFPLDLPTNSTDDIIATSLAFRAKIYAFAFGEDDAKLAYDNPNGIFKIGEYEIVHSSTPLEGLHANTKLSDDFYIGVNKVVK